MSRTNHPLLVGSQPQYGKHNMSFRHLTTMDVGRIQVMGIQECVTNDQISMNLKQVVTTAPNISPLQGKFKMHTAAFYVRNRIVMKDWDKYKTGMQNLNIPHFDLQNMVDFFTIPGTAGDNYNHLSSFGIDLESMYRTYEEPGNSGSLRSMRASLLPFRCYERVWWDWFRNSQVVPDTQESSYLYSDNNNESWQRYMLPHYANWEKDFMSNYLRTPNGDSVVSASDSSVGFKFESQGAGSSYDNIVTASPYNSLSTKASSSANDSLVNIPYYSGDNPSSQRSINTLRSALGLQAVIEKMNALGGRIKDRLKGMFGSSVSYEVLGMSELLGYNEYDVNFTNETANVSNASDTADINAFGTTNPANGTIKGQLTGASTMTEDGLSDVNYHCTEDGFFIVLSWIVPDAMLTQGIAPMWFRGIEGIAPSRFDFLTDEFVGKGFDPVYAHELVSVPRQLTPTAQMGFDLFKAVGFNAKYHNYTYHHDVVSGDFRRPYTSASMGNWLVERDVLKEQRLKTFNNTLAPNVTGDDINDAVVFNNFQGLSFTTRGAYDATFMYTGSDVDHFVVQNKFELIMTRRLPSAPRVDLLTQTPVNTGIGGTRL